MFLVSFIIGLIIVISSIFLIRQEFNRAVRSQKMILEQSRVYKDEDLFTLLESLQSSVDEMNRAFYEIAADLEGKYSVHEKEIELINKHLLSLQATKKQKTEESSTKASIKAMQAKAVNKVEEEAVVPQNISREDVLLDNIIAMRSEGKPLNQIAKELGIGMGELQLLLTLKK